MSGRRESISAQREVALVEVLDRALGAGVVITGDLTLSLADIDLVYLNLRLLVGSVGTINGEFAENDESRLLALGGSGDEPA
jgi:hypothetical protein